MQSALDHAANWCVTHPRIEAIILCAVIYGAFWFEGRML